MQWKPAEAPLASQGSSPALINPPWLMPMPPSNASLMSGWNHTLEQVSRLDLEARILEANGTTAFTAYLSTSPCSA